MPVVLFAFALFLSRLMKGAWPDLGLLREVDYLHRIGILPAIGLWLLTFGLDEETGWRAFVLPRLQARRSAFSASLLLGVLWDGWHAPAFFYHDTTIAIGLLGPLMLLSSVIIASIICTWLYNGTRGSLLMVVLFHGLFNFFSVSSAGGESAPARVVNVAGDFHRKAHIHFDDLMSDVYLATSPEVEGISGEYFIKKAIVKSSPESYDLDIAGRLWEASVKLCGLSV